MRFPEFSGEWEKFRNCTLFKVISEKNKNYEFSTVLSASQTEGMVLRDSLGIDIKFEEDSIKTYKIVRNGDYVAHLRSFQGGFAFSDKTGVCSPAYTILRPSETISYGFLKPYFMSRKFIDSLRIVTYGIRDGKSISVEEWLRLYTCIPKKNEQQKISKLLRLIDNRIKTQKKIIEDLKKLKEAINNSLHNNINEFQLFSFNELGNDYSGLTGKSSDDFGSGLPYISYLNVFRNDIVTDGPFDCVKVSKTEKQNIVSYGDLLFTLSSETPSEVGIGAVYLGKTNPLYLNSFCFGVHLSNQENIYGPYLAYFVTSQYFRRTILPFAQGSTRYNLMKSDFMKHKFCFPNIASQKAIYNTLHTLSEKIQNEEVCLNKYTEQKQYLLTRLFI